MNHALVQPQRAPPFDRKKLGSLTRLHLELWEMFGQDLSQVVSHDVGVSNDGRVIDDLTDSVYHKNDVSYFSQSIGVRAELFVATEKPFTWKIVLHWLLLLN